jgi:hypothetical protein
MDNVNLLLQAINDATGTINAIDVLYLPIMPNGQCYQNCYDNADDRYKVILGWLLWMNDGLCYLMHHVVLYDIVRSICIDITDRKSEVTGYAPRKFIINDSYDELGYSYELDMRGKILHKWLTVEECRAQIVEENGEEYMSNLENRVRCTPMDSIDG